MIAHSISILPELKMSSFGLYTGAKMRFLSIALSTATWKGRANCSTVPQLRELVIRQ